MKLLATHRIEGNGKKIELLQGDLSERDENNLFDLLVVSAFPDDYIPTPTSLIGALYRNGLSVESLALDKEIDLRQHFSCWLSNKIFSDRFSFNRILCFEPLYKGDPPQVIGDIFRSLMPILGDKTEIKSIAIPLVTTGDQAWPVEKIIKPLLDASRHWLEIGMPIDVIKIVSYSDTKSQKAKHAFEECFPSREISTRNKQQKYDILLSYSRKNFAQCMKFHSEILKNDANINIFLDKNSISIGESWQSKIYESIDYSRLVVVFLSEDYIKSDVCKDEYNIALLREREAGRAILFPIYLFTAELPTYMKMKTWVDCREGDNTRLEEAAAEIIRQIKQYKSR